jgi:uncharacterized protein (DUF433 family)
MSEALMTWHDFITTDPGILGGKPTVRGTRLAVEFLLGLLAAGWTREQLLASYPQLSDEALRAIFAYAAEVTQDEPLHVVRRDQ